MSVQAMSPRQPVPRTLRTASLAAKRPARWTSAEFVGEAVGLFGGGEAAVEEMAAVSAGRLAMRATSTISMPWPRMGMGGLCAAKGAVAREGASGDRG